MTKPLTNLHKAALLSGKTVWDTRDYPQYGVTSFCFSDGPHGVRRQLGSADHLGLNSSQPATCFPTAATVANSWDPDLVTKMGEALGVEAASLGVDVLLGPGLNIKRSPLGGRCFEYYSEDPYLAGRMASALVRGIQSSNHVSACPKHFAVNSQETRRLASDSVLDERTLRELYLTAFEIVVKQAKPNVIMTSYNRINGTYANENAHLLTDILRNEWGFDGMVVTDWGGGVDPVKAVAAGGGVEMPAPGLDSARQICDALAQGRLSQAHLDARADEVLAMAHHTKSIDHSVTADTQAHHDLARRLAEASIVLLRNHNATLPLAEGTKVAVIGDMARNPRYQGAGSSQINPTSLSDALDVIETHPGLECVGYAQGYQRLAAADPRLIDQAVALAKQADVALVFCGLDEVSESEGMDRSTIDLPQAQIDLIGSLSCAGTPVVAVLSAGSVVDLTWSSKVDGLVHSYLSGQAGAEAIVNVLTGAVNPSGKLAESYPIRLSDTPTAKAFPAAGRYAYYKEGLFVGYRYYDTADVEVAYPFGFGLSYSTFTYSDLTVDDNGVTFTLTNDSDRAGAEVAQLYIAKKDSRVIRPAKELKGFVKVTLDAGESRQVRIDFDEYAWRFFDVETDSWQIEDGDYEVMVASSSRDIKLSAIVEKSGITPTNQREAFPHYVTGEVDQVSDDEFARLLGRDLPIESATDEITDATPIMNFDRAPLGLARFAAKFLAKKNAKSLAAGVPDLNTIFVLNMPLRAIAKMTNGMVNKAMVDALVHAVNGHFFSGLSFAIRAFFANRRDNRSCEKRLSQ